MHCTRKINEFFHYVGSSDRRLALFENAYPIPRGVSYNSYLALDDKTVLLDTADKSVSQVFFENVDYVLNSRPLDYVIVNHMEPDHAATLGELIMRHPEVKVVANAKTVAMIKQFFSFDVDSRLVCVKESDTLNTGKLTFAFTMTPMVHWPEVMMSYEVTTKTLFSADAFGTFGALSGNLYADQYDFPSEWLDDARRYYTNIVGKYGVQVQMALKKAAALDIAMICPLHGPIWRKDLGWFIDKYSKWSSYTPEDKGVLILYGTVYGNTANAADILANMLSEKCVGTIKEIDVSKAHPSEVVSDSFRFSHIVFASSTYNAGIFTPMEIAVTDLKLHNLQNRKCAVFENGTWAPSAASKIREILSGMKNMEVVEKSLLVKSSVSSENLKELEEIATELAKDF